MALVIFSETNTLTYLNRCGIYPDIFYTDFKKFCDDVPLMDNVDILIIITGGCEVPRRKLITEFSVLRGLQNSEYANITSVEVLSDLQLPQIEDYYRYFNGNLFEYKHYIGWHEVHSDGGFKLKDYRSKPKPCEIHLSKTDLGVTKKYTELLQKTYSKQASGDEVYRNLILEGVKKQQAQSSTPATT